MSTGSGQTQSPFWLQPESRRLEFKEAWPGGEKIARTAVAFANGAWERIVFGVRNEPRVIIGLSDKELFSLEERVSNHIFDRCVPAIVPKAFIQDVDGRALLVVEIHSGAQKPYHLKAAGRTEGTYVRIGSANRKASQEVIAALERARRKISFDEEAQYDVSWQHLDLSSFEEAYRKATGRTLDDAAYRNLGLVVEDRDERHPTVAAILLSDGPVKRRVLPYAKIECARFKGTDTRVFLDQATFDGPVYASIEPCIAFIKRNIALGARVGEVYREDRWEYPLEAIREAVTNAVVHRDYAITGSDIKVAIFDDMLEVTSPGPLPDTLSPEALGTGRSEIRNRVLAPIFKDLGLIEAWGTGIRRMRAELETYPEIDLVLQEVAQAFQVQFVRKKAQEGQEAQDEAQEAHVEAQVDLSAIELQMISACDEGPAGSNELLNAVGYKTRTGNFKNSLSRLLELGMIEMTIPDKPRSSKQRYRLTPKGRDALRRSSTEEQG